MVTVTDPDRQRNGQAAAARSRNPRGLGQRLRDELIDAAMTLLDQTGDPAALSLRAVAKQAGIAAPSIYRHFPDLNHLKHAVVERCFTMFSQARSSAANGVSDPGSALIAGARAYCEFGLSHPGHYQLMFGPDPEMPASLKYDSQQSPGRQAFHTLVGNIRECQESGAARATGDPFHLAANMWAFEHGLVSLRLNRPHFPWPPLEDSLRLGICQLLSLGDEKARVKLD